VGLADLRITRASQPDQPQEGIDLGAVGGDVGYLPVLAGYYKPDPVLIDWFRSYRSTSSNGSSPS
jgi:hypothetical protein